jgi:outer membrane lipoprotein SlyB
MKKTLILTFFLGISTLGLCSCTGTQIGTTTGAAAGAGLGYAVSGGSALGTVLGAGAGGLIGNSIGQEQDRRAYYRNAGYYYY